MLQELALTWATSCTNQECGTTEQLRTKGPQDFRLDDPLIAGVHRVLLDAALEPLLGRCCVLLPEAPDDLQRHAVPNYEHAMRHSCKERGLQSDTQDSLRAMICCNT